MNETTLPSTRRLLSGVALALGVALVLLFTVVLPADYGIDPLRIGRVLGLTAMAQSQPAPPTASAAMHPHPRKFYTGKIEINVKPREELEYKARLAQGEPLLYSWTVQGGHIDFEFHGEPTEGEWPKDYYQSYQIGKSSQREQGSFVAPFTGQHGWYWRNLGEEPVTIVLEAHGYYTQLGRVEQGAARVD